MDKNGTPRCPACGDPLESGEAEVDHYPGWTDRAKWLIGQQDPVDQVSPESLNTAYNSPELRVLCSECKRLHIWEDTPASELPFADQFTRWEVNLSDLMDWLP